IIKEASKDIFVPITVGGGIRKIEDIQEALNAGADKVAINTQAIRNPEFIKDASKVFGSQCIVSSIVAKRIAPNRWEAFVENGREPTGINVIEWAKKVETLGAGEIMLTSIDKEGTKKGFDLELNAAVSSVVTIPLIASGGAGKEKDIVDVLHIQGINAIALASTLHYNLVQVDSLKKSLFEQEIEVRV
ncbi:MAG: imidazole glycerol phosphate synthase cyclase subunit, partial [Epsilonproteobacteria bacterium]